MRTFGRGGEPWNRADSIALASLIVAVLGLIIASSTFIPTYLGYRETRRSNEISLSPPSATEPQARTQLAALAVKRISAIDAEIHDASEEGNGKDRDKINGTVIDVTLKNTGDAPSLITRADFRFARIAQLSGCPTGGGPLDIFGLYDIKVPDKKAPFTIQKEMKYEVRPHSYERLAFKVGPGHISDGDWPYLYEIDITLHLDPNALLRIGKVQMMQPALLEPVQPSPPNTAEQDACQTKNAEMLRSFAESPGGTPSADLLALNKKWLAFRQDSEPAKEVCTQDAVSDNPKALLDIVEFCATYKRSELMVRLKGSSHVNELQNRIEVAIQLPTGERYALSSALYGYGASTCIGKEGADEECSDSSTNYSAEWRENEAVIKAFPLGFSAQKDLRLTAKLYNSKLELPDIADAVPDNGQSLHITRGR